LNTVLELPILKQEKLCGSNSVALGLIKINTNQTITMTNSDVSMHNKNW